MPRRSRIRIGALEDLAAQLRFAPRRTALRQIDRAEKLAEEIDPSKSYAEDWVIWKITGYRTKIAEPSFLVGEALLGDLSAFVERLSDETRLTLTEVDADVLTLDELCARWRVARKTVERYRRLGLLGVRARNADGASVLVFKRGSVERFEARHSARIRAAGEFRRLDENERDRITHLARQITEESDLSASAVAARIAPHVGRGRETIRRSLLESRSAAGEPAFTSDGALSARQRLIIWRAHRWGVPVSRIGERFNRSRAAVHRVINERRAELLRRLDLSGPVSPVFVDDQRADALLRVRGVSTNLGNPGEATVEQFVQVWRDAHAMDAAAERALAQAYCLIKFRCARIVASLARQAPGSRRLDEVETLLRWAAQIKAELVRTQSGLALRSVEERIGPIEVSPVAAARWIIVAMDAACKAAEQFDPFRGGRLSAAASLAMARALVDAEVDSSRTSTLARRSSRQDIPLPDWTRRVAPWNAWLAPHELLREASAGLPAPLGEAVRARFGLGGKPPKTMGEIRREFGLTEARIARATIRATRLARAASARTPAEQ